MQHLKRKHFSIMSLIWVLISTSCTHPLDKSEITAKSICGTWTLQSMSGRKLDLNTSDEMIIAAKNNELVQKGVVISIFEDQQFTDICGNGSYVFGTWNLNLDNHTIKLDGKTKKSMYRYVSKFENERLILDLSNVNNSEKMTFVKTGEPLENFKQDQFYPENNSWRIKATHKESPSELKARMANHIKHVAYILKSASERKNDIVSFTYSLGPVKIYNGGVGAHDFTLIPAEWKQTFLDESQALDAYYIYTDYLRNSVYRGANTGDWVRDDLVILESIYADFMTKNLSKTD